jgi:hypothetical protein
MKAVVDSGFALYLQSAEKVADASDDGHAAIWGALARSLSMSSGIATEADAILEAQNVLNFFKGPLIEVKEVIGKIIDISAIKGKVLTINGIATFVLGGGADDASGTSYIEGIRRGAA